MRKHLLKLLAVALGLVLLFWSTRSERPSSAGRSAAEVPVVPAEATGSAPPNPFWDLAAQASAKADTADATAPLDLQRWEADWCKQAQGLPARHRWQSLLEHLEAGPPAMRALHARMVQKLQAMGNERALSVADSLIASLGGLLAPRHGMTPSSVEQRVAAEARARLRHRALSSSDGFFIALALQRGCESDACSLQLSRRWQQVEPHNLQAQLAVLSRGSAADSDGVLTALAQASVSENYRSDYMALLMQASEQPSAGPLQLMREMDAMALGAAFAVPDYHKLLQLCEAAQSSRLQRCNEVAERLWTLAQDSIIEPSTALAMAKKQVQPAAHWQRRTQELEAAQQVLFSDEDPDRWAADTLGCQSSERSEAMRIALGREWPFLLAAAQARGIETLAQKYREQRQSMREQTQRPSPAASR